MNTSFQTIQDTLSSAKRVALFGHERPDGDSIGSVLGLYHLLTSNTSAKVTPHTLDDVPENLAFLPGFDLVEREYTEGEYDLLVILDTANAERCGLTTEQLSATRTLVIDHHQSNEGYGDQNWIDPHASSVAEMLTTFAQELGWEMPADAAECLLTGIYTDTGGFIHRNTSQYSFEQAALLVAKGADNQLIAEKVFKSNSFEFQKDLGTLLSRMTMYTDVNFCSMYGYEEAAGKDLKTVLVSMLNSIEGVRYACVLTQDGENVRGSLRTNRNDVNVSDMAAVYGGGGHTKASGFYFPGQLVRTEEGEDYIEKDGEKMSVEEFLKTLEK